MVFLLLFATITAPFAQATQTAYVQQDADRLRALFERASSRADSLLVRYRLYPLTEDETVLEGIPSSLSEGSAREYALLSGLWAYRAGEASFFTAFRRGRRSTNLLEKAKAQAPDDPFVLLVEGQSLLFRPAIAGKSPVAASKRFARLAKILRKKNVPGISRTEAQIWQWMALRKANHAKQAETLWTHLRERDLPPLYRQFLEDPFEV